MIGAARIDVVRRVAGGWAVFSARSDRRLSRAYPDPDAADKRLAEIEMFKHMRKDSKVARKRLPRQIPPTMIEMEYGNAIIRKLEGVFALYKPLLAAAAGLIASARGERMDAGEGRRVRDIVAHAREAAAKTIKREDIEDLARKFAERTSTYQRIQLSRQVHAALGADPVLRDRDLAAASEHFVHENAALITSIPDELHGDVESMVQRAIGSATPSPKLAKHIEERFGVSRRKARFIARDQISKHQGKLNRARQKELGVNKFVWRSVGDERVRDWHRDELDGNTYHWDKPPLSEDGEPIIPGEDYQCRCSAEPLL